MIPSLRTAVSLGQCTCLLALFAILPACRTSARAKEHVEKGNQYLQERHFTEAENEYQQAIEIDPDLADAHYRLGILELQGEHPTAATNSLSRAVELDRRNLDARLRLGNLLVAATQYGKAREQAEAVLSMDGQNAGGHRLLGQIALQQTQYVAAENELQQAIRLSPRDPQLFGDLGLAQLLDAEYGAAEKSFQTAVAIQPRDPTTYINLANFYKGQNGSGRAEQVLRQGMASNPRDMELPVALAGLYLEGGHKPDARRVLETIEADESDFPDGQRAVAEFYLNNGDSIEAMRRFRALADRSVRDLDAARKVAECYLQLSQWQEANNWIDRHDAKDADFRLLRARSYLGAFRLREAVDVLKSLVKDSPDAPAVFYYLAQAYIRQEEPAAAQQALNDALRAQPGYLPAILGLGNIGLQQSNPAVALNYASQVIATSFWVADAHVLAGSANLMNGDLDQAERAFELAVGLNPRSPEAEERMGKVLSLRGKNSDAEKAYEASLALAPDYAPALSGLSELLLKQGRSKQAGTRINGQIAAHPNAYQLLVAKAEFCVAQKDWMCAERSYKEALNQNPYYVNGYLALAHVDAATNRPQEMLHQYEAARTKFPDYLPTYILMGQVYAYLGNVNQAEQTYEDALKIDPNFYLAQTNLARLFADHAGPLAYALELAQKAKASQPDDPNVNDTLGWIYYKQGVYASAVPILEAAVTKSPQVAGFQFHLGMVYLAVGQRVQARTTLQTSLNLGLSPDDARAAQQALQETGS